MGTQERYDPGTGERATRNCRACNRHYKRFLELAPAGHWHIPRAALVLAVTQSIEYAHVSGCTDLNPLSLYAMVRDHPEYPAKSFAYYKQGVAAAQTLNECYGAETRDFQQQVRLALELMTSFHQMRKIDEWPLQTLICSSLICYRNYKRDSLKRCSSCKSVQYCCVGCQKQDWKSGVFICKSDGHKKDCKLLKAGLKPEGSII